MSFLNYNLHPQKYLSCEGGGKRRKRPSGLYQWTYRPKWVFLSACVRACTHCSNANKETDFSSLCKTRKLVKDDLLEIPKFSFSTHRRNAWFEFYVFSATFCGYLPHPQHYLPTLLEIVRNSHFSLKDLHFSRLNPNRPETCEDKSLCVSNGTHESLTQRCEANARN